MNAGAWVAQSDHAGILPSCEPLVFVDGVPEPALVVRQWSTSAPLDRRAVELEAPLDTTAATLDRWMSGEVAVALPHRLAGAAVRWTVLASGRLVASNHSDAPGAASVTLCLEDTWSAGLVASPAHAWIEDRGRLLAAHPRLAILRGGDRANRSDTRWTLHGHAVYVLQDHGQTWTVGEALRTVFAFAGATANLDLVPGDVMDLPVVGDINLYDGVARALSPLLGSLGLMIRRELRREAGRITQRAAVIPAALGRIVGYASAADGKPEERQSRSDRAWVPAARQWVVRSPGWVVEGTFSLQFGWDAALTTLDDTAYARSTNSAFATVSDVFRLWVLNEDNHFTGARFGNPESFDLAAFFSEPGVPATPLRFLECVSLTAAGLPRPVTVEISGDSGATWFPYPGAARVRSDRAAIYLDDDAIPPSFLAACKAGAGRVRVTASLRNPLPVESRRWRGNPFVAGAGDAAVEQVNHFVFRKVGPTSEHRLGVESGEVLADQRDDGLAQRAYLRQKLLRAGLDTSGRAVSRVTLNGARPWIASGDRWADGRLIASVECRWPGWTDKPGPAQARTVMDLLDR